MKNSPWAWRFWYRVEDLLREALWILVAQICAWTDSGVNSEDEILPTLIDPELENTGKITKNKMLTKKEKRKIQK